MTKQEYDRKADKKLMIIDRICAYTDRYMGTTYTLDDKNTHENSHGICYAAMREQIKEIGIQNVLTELFGLEIVLGISIDMSEALKTSLKVKHKFDFQI